MGTINHNAIVVTSFLDDLISTAHDQAKVRFSHLVTEVSKSSINGFKSFAILPDGSKEWWPESDAMNDKRKEYCDYLDSLAYEDGSNSIDYVDVSFGELGAKVERTNCEEK